MANAGPDQLTQTLFALTFSGSGSSDPDGTIGSYAWTFGDGGSVSGVSVSHTYATAGTFTATLVVTDNAGATATDTATVQVLNRPPVANAGPDQSANIGTVLGFSGTGSSDPDGTLGSYAWSFGDGTSATGATVSKAYSAVGTYTVTITVTDNLGATAIDTAVVTITGAPPVGGDLVWARRAGSSGFDEAKGVALDASGNILVTGEVVGPIDLGGGMTCARSILIAKYTPAGTPLWAQCLGADTGGGGGRGIAADADGNVVVTGYFRGTVDFGGGPLSSPDGYDIFLAKYSAAGVHQWSHRFGSPIVGALVTESGNGVAVDGGGNIVVTGTFEGTADFGGGPLTSAGQGDIFLAKYSPAGTHLWSKRFGNTFTDVGNGVAVDRDGNIVMTGNYLYPVDFGGGALTSGSYDVFVAKYSPTGAHLWSQRFGGTLTDEGRAIAVDGGGNVLVTGLFQNTIDLGGGPLTSAGGNDIFVAKYSPAGTHVWSKRFGGTTTYDMGNGLAVDAAGNVVVTGVFAGTIDFGTGGLTSAGSKDAFAAKFSSTGAARWAKRFGSTSIDAGVAVAADGSGNVVAAGSFFSTVDFGAGPLVSAGSADVFLLRLQP